MTKRTNHSARGAFLLLELVAVLALLGVFLMIATETIMLCHHAQIEALRRTALENRVDAAMHRLREDVWNASALQVNADGTLALTRGQQQVTWQAFAIDHPTLAGEDAELVRQENGVKTEWAGLPGARFAVAGAVVTVTFHSAGVWEGKAVVLDETLTLESPLAGGVR